MDGGSEQAEVEVEQQQALQAGKQSNLGKRPHNMTKNIEESTVRQIWIKCQEKSRVLEIRETEQVKDLGEKSKGNDWHC